MLTPSFLSGGTPLWISLVFIAIDLIIRAVALGVLPHNRRPSAAWGWLLAIFFIPIIGVLLYLVLGNLSLPEQRRQKQAAIPAIAGTAKTDGDEEAPIAIAAGKSSDLPDWALAAVQLNHRLTGLPMVAGNSAEILSDYTASIERIARAVESATRSAYLEFYIVASDTTTERLFRAVEDAHARGVEVKVLIDHIGSLGFPGYDEAVRRLDAHGIPWHRSLPVRPWRLEYQRPDLRNHRKVVIIDDAVAFVGSQNMIDASYNKKKNLREHLQWKDLMVRLEGPVVAQLNAVFLADWHSEAGGPLPASILPAPSSAAPAADGLLCQVLPSGAGNNPGKNQEVNLRLFNHLFYSAKNRVAVSCPYFVPEESTLIAITTAAQRGVNVQLFVGESSDHPLTHHAQRSYYEMLLRAGVKIHRYTPPYILHSKFVLVDDDVAVIASSNMDIRSFALNLELDLMVCDRGFVRRMDEIVAGYENNSTPLTLEEWMSRPLLQRYIDNVARLTASLQ